MRVVGSLVWCAIVLLGVVGGAPMGRAAAADGSGAIVDAARIADEAERHRALLAALDGGDPRPWDVREVVRHAAAFGDDAERAALLAGLAARETGALDEPTFWLAAEGIERDDVMSELLRDLHRIDPADTDLALRLIDAGRAGIDDDRELRRLLGGMVDREPRLLRDDPAFGALIEAVRTMESDVQLRRLLGELGVIAGDAADVRARLVRLGAGFIADDREMRLLVTELSDTRQDVDPALAEEGGMSPLREAVAEALVSIESDGEHALAISALARAGRDPAWLEMLLVSTRRFLADDREMATLLGDLARRHPTVAADRGTESAFWSAAATIDDDAALTVLLAATLEGLDGASPALSRALVLAREEIDDDLAMLSFLGALGARHPEAIRGPLATAWTAALATVDPSTADRLLVE